MFAIYLASVAEWLKRETHNLKVADRNRNVAELLNRGIFLLFRIAFYRDAFCRVLARVSEEQLQPYIMRTAHEFLHANIFRNS